MNVLGVVITAGVVILAIALLTYAVGKTMVSLPAFGPSDAGGHAADPIGAVFNDTMAQVNTNAGTAFTLIGISPIVLGAAAIISILIGAFVMYGIVGQGE